MKYCTLGAFTTVTVYSHSETRSVRPATLLSLNKTGTVYITQQCVAFASPLLQWKQQSLLCVCVRACVCVCVCVKSPCIFSVFVSLAIKHFTRSDGIDQLWSSNCYILWLFLDSCSYIRHEKCVRLIMSTVACLTLSHFSTLSHKQHDLFGKKFISHIIYS
jgi:hypothetical protein